MSQQNRSTNRPSPSVPVTMGRSGGGGVGGMGGGARGGKGGDGQRKAAGKVRERWSEEAKDLQRRAREKAERAGEHHDSYDF